METNTPNINISRQNVSGKCDLKCSYNFKYNKSNSTATNNGIMISLSYDNSVEPPVIYNSQKYIVSNVFITSPSVHMFDGKLVDAEIIIEHTPILGGSEFKVGIPIISGVESSMSSIFLTEIIETVSTNAPSEGDSTNLNMNDFTLQEIVPNKQFFNYISSDNNQNIWVVFGSLHAITISKHTLKTLSQIIQAYPLPTPGNELFINEVGPNKNKDLGDGIYISCNPTDSSQEEVPVSRSKNNLVSDISFSSFFTNNVVQIILGCIMLIFIFLYINKFYNYFVKPIAKPAKDAIIVRNK